MKVKTPKHFDGCVCIDCEDKATYEMLRAAAQIDFGGGKSIHTDGRHWYACVDFEELPGVYKTAIAAYAAIKENQNA